MTRKPKPGVIRAAFTIIGEMYREAPRTMALLTIAVLWIIGWSTYAVATSGWTALLWIALLVAFVVGSRFAVSWALKRDGIEK